MNQNEVSLEAVDKNLSFHSIEPHLKKLRACGFYQLSPDSPKLHKVYQWIYMRIILFSILIFFVQQIMKVYQVKVYHELFNLSVLKKYI